VKKARAKTLVPAGFSRTKEGAEKVSLLSTGVFDKKLPRSPQFEFVSTLLNRSRPELAKQDRHV
jgi:hypothetical protein